MFLESAKVLESTKILLHSFELKQKKLRNPNIRQPLYYINYLNLTQQVQSRWCIHRVPEEVQNNYRVHVFCLIKDVCIFVLSYLETPLSQGVKQASQIIMGCLIPLQCQSKMHCASSRPG